MAAIGTVWECDTPGPTPYAAYRAAVALGCAAIGTNQTALDAIKAEAGDDEIKRLLVRLGLVGDLADVLDALGLAVEAIGDGRAEAPHARPRSYFEAVLGRRLAA